MNNHNSNSVASDKGTHPMKHGRALWDRLDCFLDVNSATRIFVKGLFWFLIIAIAAFLVMYITDFPRNKNASAIATLLQSTFAAAAIFGVSIALLKIASNSDKTFEKQRKVAERQRHAEHIEFLEKFLREAIQPLMQFAINMEHLTFTLLLPGLDIRDFIYDVQKFLGNENPKKNIANYLDESYVKMMSMIRGPLLQSIDEIILSLEKCRISIGTCNLLTRRRFNDKGESANLPALDRLKANFLFLRIRMTHDLDLDQLLLVAYEDLGKRWFPVAALWEYPIAFAQALLDESPESVSDRNDDMLKREILQNAEDQNARVKEIKNIFGSLDNDYKNKLRVLCFFSQVIESPLLGLNLLLQKSMKGDHVADLNYLASILPDVDQISCYLNDLVQHSDVSEPPRCPTFNMIKYINEERKNIFFSTFFSGQIDDIWTYECDQILFSWPTEKLSNSLSDDQLKDLWDDFNRLKGLNYLRNDKKYTKRIEDFFKNACVLFEKSKSQYKKIFYKDPPLVSG